MRDRNNYVTAIVSGKICALIELNFFVSERSDGIFIPKTTWMFRNDAKKEMDWKEFSYLGLKKTLLTLVTS